MNIRLLKIWGSMKKIWGRVAVSGVVLHCFSFFLATQSKPLAALHTHTHTCKEVKKMEIKQGQLKLDKATMEINVYLHDGSKTTIMKTTQDKLNRVYITV